MNAKQVLSADPEARRRLLALRLQGRGAMPAVAVPALGPQAVVRIPLSPHQHAMWALDRVLPNRALYNTHQAVRVIGPLNVDALRLSVTAIARRHGALRTTFSGTATAEQVVHPRLDPDFAFVDLSGIVADPENEGRERAEADVREPFDLVTGPLFRIRVYRIAAEHHLMVMIIHHIVSDGWSLEVIMAELAVAYPAAGDGIEAAQAALADRLGATPPQYREYVEWLDQRRADGTEAADLAAWQDELRDIPANLDLATDHPRPASLSYRGALATRVLPVEVSAQLRAFARQHDVALFTLLLTGYQLLLHRYSGAAAFNVGTVVAGRSLPRGEGIIGLIANTVALPIRLDPGDTVTGVLARERRRLLGAVSRQAIAFGQVVEAVQPVRDGARNPLFQNFFLHRDPGHGDWRLPGLDLTPLEFDTGLTKFELSLSTADDGSTITMHLAYLTELFDAATAERFLRHYEQLLSIMIAAPDVPIVSCDPLTSDDRAELLAACSGIQRSRPPITLVDLLEQAAQRHPARTAVSLGPNELTYAELHRRADALARRLRACGATADRPVGICLDRSLDLMVAVLAVLKSGAPYLPLDPGYPVQRLSYMLTDSRAELLLTSEPAPVEIPDFTGRRLVVGAEPDEPAACPEPPHPANLAYVIYTSGSTGRPKGVQISHEGIVNRLLWMQEEYGLTPDDRVLQKTPISFDVSTWELFWPLLTGARLVLAAPGGHVNPRYLAGLIKEERITVCHFVPSLLRGFLDEPTSGPADSLRLVVCSGEALPPDVARQSLEAFPGARVANLYGPTEASVDVTAWNFASGAPRGPVPIGRAIANIRCLVLDERMELPPPGAPGELYLGGVGLARGYLGRPGLTAERFVPDPWSAEPGARLYRTGDIARVRPDGVIDYCGRVDHQVKINGVRIELGEIEARLCELDGIRDAVVVQSTAENQRGRLIAHVVLDPAYLGAASDLRTALAEQLPRNMVPSQVVRHDELPKGPAGKTDRSALARLVVRPEPDGDHGRPEYATLTEAAIAAIWSEVLATGVVAATANFFEAGGDSLLAITCCGRMATSGYEIEPQEFLRLQTVRRIAAHIDAAAGRETAV